MFAPNQAATSEGLPTASPVTSDGSGDNPPTPLDDFAFDYDLSFEPDQPDPGFALPESDSLLRHRINDSLGPDASDHFSVLEHLFAFQDFIPAFESATEPEESVATGFGLLGNESKSSTPSTPKSPEHEDDIDSEPLNGPHTPQDPTKMPLPKWKSYEEPPRPKIPCKEEGCLILVADERTRRRHVKNQHIRDEVWICKNCRHWNPRKDKHVKNCNNQTSDGHDYRHRRTLCLCRVCAHCCVDEEEVVVHLNDVHQLPHSHYDEITVASPEGKEQLDKMERERKEQQKKGKNKTTKMKKH